MSRLQLKDALIYGWEALRRQPSRWIVPALAYGVISEGLALPLDAIPDERWLLLILATGLYLVLSSFLLLGITRASLKAYDGAPLHWKDPFDFSHHPVSYLVASLMLGGIFIVGIFLGLVPGFIALALLGFALWLVADRGTRPGQALRESWELTRGNRLRVLAFTAIVMVPSVLTGMMLEQGGLVLILALGVQAVLTVIGVNATTHLYRQLQGRREAA